MLAQSQRLSGAAQRLLAVVSPLQLASARIERAKYRHGVAGDFNAKLANTAEGIRQLLEAGSEHVLPKEGLAYFRKRK